MDQVDRILEQWRAARPDLDARPMAVIGRLSRAAAAVDARLAETFARHGIDAATFDVLATLVRQGAPHELAPADLAADAMISSSAVAQRLNRLESLGLITRHPDPRDGRGKLVRLSAAGREVIDRALPDHLATEEAVLEVFTDEERTVLAGLLRRFVGTGTSPGRPIGARPPRG
ncbi:MarR family winged helix-turn-helix transcriptional regulator [Microbacterium oleivorans]|uniref:MarR family transcriptional regulator n=1 Tax=Microbacterium oleivorans TaxID=273677 RepID=A0A7D5IRM9_9MICO|nr:MarR family transcriptional regulator [Microbacterium oleivorans]QLD10634.1 MarR family transcriptional regulator [Microbacterium oleivorans]